MSPASEPRVAVIGCGVMGAGIAQVFAAGGHAVSLYDPDAAALDTAHKRIQAGLALLELPVDESLTRISRSSQLPDAVRGARLIIEAGPELLVVKREIFSALSSFAAADAVLASNTSAIPIGEIAVAAAAPERVIGTHFWNPPYLLPLVEVVQSDQSDPRCVEWTIALLTGLGLKPVHVRHDVAGFVGNRLQHALKREAIALVAAGVCDAETIDTVVKDGFGRRLGVLGPLEQSDLSGLMLTLQIHEVLMPSLDRTDEAHPLLREKVQRGELGASTGRGFRSWAPGEADALRARVDEELRALSQRKHNVDTGPG